MARRKQEIQVHYSQLRVRLRDSVSPRAYGLSSREGLSGHLDYRVIATYLHRWGDGTTSPAFLVEGNAGRLLERVATIFEVVHLEE